MKTSFQNLYIYVILSFKSSKFITLKSCLDLLGKGCNLIHKLNENESILIYSQLLYGL